MTHLPTKPKTKSERIKHFLRAGWSPVKIAKELDTTIDYVYKEKGKFKRQGLLITQQTLKITDGRNDITVIKDQPVSDPLQGDQIYGNLDYNVPPLEQKDIKSLYSCFEKNMNASEVIAEHGFRPDISEREYRRFLTIKSRDPVEFQKRLISKFSEVQNETEIQPLVDKASQGLSLTNSELLSIVDIYAQVFALGYVRKVVSNPSLSVPGVGRLLCSFCQLPQPGVLFGNSVAADFLVSRAPRYACPRCQDIESVVSQEYKRPKS